jgi:NADH-quinone oxidoreductase subunit E
MFKRAPVGDYLLSVCTNPTCKVAGAQTIFERYRKALGGQLTDLDTGVSIEEAECLGICDAAPVVQVNYDMYGPLTDDEADRLLDGCRKGSPPVSSWSGEAAPTFREVERELSGANDTFLAANAAASRHSVEYPVPPAYKTGETDIPVTAPGGDPAGHGGALFAEAFGAAPSTPDADQAAVAAADDAPAPDEVEESSLAIGDDHVPGATQEPSTTGATEPAAADPAPEADATQGSPADDQSEEA